MGDRSPLTRYFLGPVAAARVLLLRKLILGCLAVDVLATHLSPAWRYGAAGFNVAHFSLFDRVLPLPTTALYVGMLVLVSIGAALSALMAKPPRALILAVGVLYTWGWSCSMHDSYQHHYLISLLVLTLAFSPVESADELLDGTHGEVPRTHALGYAMTSTLAAVVYSYTAVSKTEPDWLSGAAMRSITHDGELIRPLMNAAESIAGITGDDFWWLLGHSVVPVQVICAVGYFTAPLRDGALSTSADRELTTRAKTAFADPARVGAAIALLVGATFAIVWLGLSVWIALPLAAAVSVFALPREARGYFFSRPTALDAIAWLALPTALSFHVGADLIALEIGWFSLYMIALAFVVFLPGTWVTSIVRIGHALTQRAHGPALASMWLPLAMGAILAMLFVGHDADLPGAFGATGLVAVGLFATLVGTMTGRWPIARIVSVASAALFAAVIVYATLHRGEGRYDFYRFAGGDFRRRGELEQAEAAYVRANRHAPPGQNRTRQLEDVRRELERRH